MQKPNVEMVFAGDEMTLIQPHTFWTREELLGKEGIFFLKDIADHLGLDSILIKKKALALREKGDSPWELMGVKKIWNHWVIRMKVFAPYYRKHLMPVYQTVAGDWDANTLLKQKGIFLLSAVCKLVPFADHQLRYQAKKNPNSKTELGIWKDKKLKMYLVDMEPFSQWIHQLWSEGDSPDSDDE